MWSILLPCRIVLVPLQGFWDSGMGHCSPTDDMAIDIRCTTRCRFVVMLIGYFSLFRVFALQRTNGQISSGTAAVAARACASPRTTRCSGCDATSTDEMHRSQITGQISAGTAAKAARARASPCTTRCFGCDATPTETFLHPIWLGFDLAGVQAGWVKLAGVSWIGCLWFRSVA